MGYVSVLCVCVSVGCLLSFATGLALYKESSSHVPQAARRHRAAGLQRSGFGAAGGGSCALTSLKYFSGK